MIVIVLSVVIIQIRCMCIVYDGYTTENLDRCVCVYATCIRPERYDQCRASNYVFMCTHTCVSRRNELFSVNSFCSVYKMYMNCLHMPLSVFVCQYVRACRPVCMYVYARLWVCMYVNVQTGE